MNYYKNNIKHVKGDTYSSALIVEGLGQALDSVYFTCRDSLKNDSTILFEKSLADGGITQVEYDEENDIRKYAVRIDPYDTRNLQAGTYFYDLQITVNTDVFTIMKGNFILEQDASRKGEPTEPEIIIQIKAQLDEINGEVINVTVFDKLDYLSETKGLIKDSLNNLGSEITDDNTFRNYVEKINQIYNDYPKVTGTGTTFTIANTKKAKMNNTLKGNTEQTTYNGNQLVDFNNMTVSNASYTFENDVLTVSATGSNYNRIGYDITDVIKNNPNKILKFSYESFDVSQFTSSSNTLIQFRVVNNGTTSYAGLLNKTGTSSTYTVPSDTSGITNAIIQIYANNTSTENNTSQATITKPLIYFDNNNTYEPYVGGISSPNPNYPQDIRVVKGDNTINIIGKNLLDTSKKLDGYAFDNSTNKIISSSTYELYYIPIKAGETYISSSELGTSSGNIAYAYCNEFPQLNTSVVSRTTSDISILNGGTFTAPSEVKYLLIRIIKSSQTLNNWQIEKGSTATTYKPHQEQSYVFYLEDLELCKIGDYQDYIYKSNNTWYKYKAIGKVVLDGSEEGWNVRQGNNTNLYVYYLLNNLVQNSIKDSENCLSNYFIVDNTSGLIQKDGGFRIAEYSSINRIWLCVNSNIATTISNFKSWLSTYNTTVYYVLETPVSIEITDLETIEQLNSLENAISYNNETNIFTEYEEGNISLIISASALMKGSE